MPLMACPPRWGYTTSGGWPANWVRRTDPQPSHRRKGGAPPPASTARGSPPRRSHESLWRPPMHAHTIVSALGDLIAAAPLAAPKTIPQVIDGLKLWIMGILAAV